MTEQVKIQQPESNAGEQAHIDAMVAKVDGQIPAEETKPAPSEEAPARPSWLPDKFATPEDMAKAYGELETKQGGKPADVPAPELNADGTPKVAPEAPADEAAKELASKGLDLAVFSDEFSQKGELGPDSYEKLEKAGYPKAIVDQYIEGQKALAANYETEVKSAAGGADKFAEVSTWAAANLPVSEIEAYNRAIDSKDMETAKLAVAGITAKYSAANPPEGNLLGGRTSSVSGDSYGSTAEITKDMANPEYARDPAFRKKVMDKIQRSPNVL